MSRLFLCQKLSLKGILRWSMVLLFFSKNVFAQTKNIDFDEACITYKIPYSQYETYQQKSNISQLIQQHIHQSWQVSWQIVYEQKGRAGKYFLYRAYWHDCPVYGLDVKIDVFNQSHHVRLHVPLPFTKPPVINHAMSATVKPALIQNDSIRHFESCAWIWHNANLQPAHVQEIATLGHQAQDVINFRLTDGTVLRLTNLMQKQHPQPLDTPVTVKIFFPDPVTSAQTVYGGDFTDNNDLDNDALNQQLKDAIINATFNSQQQFILEDSNFIVGEYSPPVKPICYSNVPQLTYTRSHDCFEQINIFYHLQRFKSYVDSLGYSMLPGYQIKIDAHALNGTDQSAYLPTLKTLLFGEGNVDDGEDADVIIHEFTHALSHAAAPGTNTGAERRAIEEGIADFFAASYSKKISTHNWHLIFNWDGHNEFWPGRFALNGKIYPSAMVGNAFQDGEILCHALCNLFEWMPHRQLDQLVIESLFMLRPGMKFADYLDGLLLIDSLLYNANNQMIIKYAFSVKGVESIITEGDEQSTLAHQPIYWRVDKGVFYVPGMKQLMRFDVYDATGKHCISKTHVGAVGINLNELKRGIYQIRAVTGSGKAITARLMVGQL